MIDQKMIDKRSMKDALLPEMMDSVNERFTNKPREKDRVVIDPSVENAISSLVGVDLELCESHRINRTTCWALRALRDQDDATDISGRLYFSSRSGKWCHSLHLESQHLDLRKLP